MRIDRGTVGRANVCFRPIADVAKLDARQRIVSHLAAALSRRRADAAVGNGLTMRGLRQTASRVLIGRGIKGGNAMGQRFCSVCGAALSEGSSFCGACGTPAAAAGPAQPAAAPSEGMAAAPPPMASPAHAPPPVPSSNNRWKKIGFGVLGAGALILGLVQIYNAFFGAPINSSTTRQMEDTIRRDFQARGQQASHVQMTAQDRDRMTGYVTAGNSGVPGSEMRYNCTATRQDRSYFSYQCEPATSPY